MSRDNNNPSSKNDISKGKVKCKECEGTGNTYSDVTRNQRRYPIRCHVCEGTGVTDWVTDIVGKKPYVITPGVYIKETDFSIRLPIIKNLSKEKSVLDGVAINMNDILA